MHYITDLLNIISLVGDPIDDIVAAQRVWPLSLLLLLFVVAEHGVYAQVRINSLTNWWILYSKAGLLN